MLFQNCCCLRVVKVVGSGGVVADDKIDGASKNTTAMMDPWTERCGSGLEGDKRRERGG